MSDFIPGGDDFEKAKDDESPWYSRWYVWVLPALVIIGVLVAQNTTP